MPQSVFVGQIPMPVPLDAGGTAARLYTPGADHLTYWDHAAGITKWLQIGTNLSIANDTLNAASGGTTLPAGIICMWGGLLVNIPSGWLLCDGTRRTPDLRAMFVKGSAAGIDPGVTGGATLHTPAGTNSAPTFTGNSVTSSAASAGTPAGTNSAPIFTGQSGNVTAPTITWPVGVPTAANESAHTHSVTSNVAVADHSSHTHTYTDVVNHTHLQNTSVTTTGNFTAVTTAVDTSAGGNGQTPALTALSIPTANPTGGVASGTTAGPSITLTHAVTNNAVTSGAGTAHTHTLSWPAGVPTNSTVTFTPAGTVAAPTFTGSALGTHTHTVTATGAVSAPAFTGTSASYEPAYYALAFIQKAA